MYYVLKLFSYINNKSMSNSNNPVTLGIIPQIIEILTNLNKCIENKLSKL